MVEQGLDPIIALHQMVDFVVVCFLLLLVLKAVGAVKNYIRSFFTRKG